MYPHDQENRERGRIPGWVNREILINLEQKKEIYGIWQKGWATWEDCRNICRVCRDMIRKTKAHLESSLARDIKDNKYISSKMKIRENMGLLLNQMGINS